MIINHDDNIIDIIERISYALKPYGLSIEFDNLEHDGYEVLEIKELLPPYDN